MSVRRPQITTPTAFTLARTLKKGSVRIVPDAIPLDNIARLIEEHINDLVGEEISAIPLFQVETVLGTFERNSTLSGFAICAPANLTAPPSATEPIYGCAPTAQVHVSVSADGSKAFVQIQTDHLFYDFAGNWLVDFLKGSGEGYALYSGVIYNATVSLADDGIGNLSMVAVTASSLSFADSSMVIALDNPLVDLIAGLVDNLFRSLNTELLLRFMDDVLNGFFPSSPRFMI